MIAFTIVNRDDLVLSASPATTGGHETLAMIPGSTLWGALAGSLYGAGDEASFARLHSGRVRLSPGFPLTSTGQPAFPMPQSFQEPKHARGGIANDRLTDRVWNTRFGSLSENGTRVQTEALKGCFLAADGSVVRPRTAERGKAAMDKGERRVAISQFFQYEHVSAGQDWLAWIDADEAGEAEAMARWVAGGEARLGRSRRREFGGDCVMERLDAWQDPRSGQFSETAPRGSRLVLWCLSDLALSDRFGAPSLAPEPADFRIDGFSGRLDAQQSVITTRRYAPYNAYLRARDREHAVISAGSVLVYHLDKDMPLAAFRAGVGVWRERGLGLVWPNAPMLLEKHPLTAAVAAGAEAPCRRTPAAESPQTLSPEEETLFAVVSAQAMAAETAGTVTGLAKHLAKTLMSRLNAADRFGHPTPGPSQWGLVAAAARQASVADFEAALFGSDGLCVGSANRDWQTVGPALREIVRKKRTETEDVFLRAMVQAARKVARDWKPRGARA